ncbi:MAG: DEAD/DEAH box helicase [Desulfohalobiaceae bacterium]
MNNSFTGLGVLPALDHALATQGISRPTPIQTAALPVVLSGRDVFISSETGTGKTLAYLLPLAGNIEAGSSDLQVLVLAPTQELAMQIYRTALELAGSSDLGLRVQALIGGVAVKRQLDQLKRKPHLVVGSVGRVQHLIELRKLKVHRLKAVVVDEMDRLLSGDNLAPTLAVVRAAPRERQLVFVSATGRPESLSAAEKLAPAMEVVRVGGDRVSPTIEHLFLVCEEREKPVMLRKLVRALEPERAIVFAHTTARSESLSAMLTHHKLSVGDIHGTKDKLGRKKALEDLRSGRVRVLIASDLAARGLDIAGVTHVFNVDVPTQAKDYLHRVGRTGRVGEPGLAISLVTEQELGRIKRFERELGICISPVKVSRGQVHPSPLPDKK